MMDFGVFQEQIFFNTIRITVEEVPGESITIGTGFIFHIELENTPGIYLLISNRHVFGDGSKRILFDFHRKGGSDLVPDLNNPIKVETPEIKDAYFAHPDENIDLACMNISRMTEPKFNAFFVHLEPDMCANFTESELLPGSEVWFIGYPQGLYDRKHNLPILRKGYIASIPRIDFEGHPAFLIDAQVYQGSSGSPVFTLIKKKMMLIGVLSSTLVRKQKLEITNADVCSDEVHTIGLGVVLKATLVIELVNAAKQFVIGKRTEIK